MRQIKVLHVLATLRPAGAESVATSILCGLDRDRFDGAALILYPREGGPLEERLDREGIPVDSVGKRHVGFDAAVAPRIALALRRLGPDVVHTHGYPLGYVLPGWLALRIRAGVHTLHTLAPHETRRGPSRALHRLAFRAGFAPVCVSEAVEASLRASYGRPGAVIHNGIDLGRFSSPGVDRATWRAAHGVPDDALVVVAVGRLEDVKDPIGLVEAFAVAAAKEPRAWLLWAGDGTLRADAEAAARARGLGERVRFLGRREDVPDVLHAADLFATASRYEGLPGALVEAQAAGLPVVGPQVGGIPEVVSEGRSALLVPPGDLVALGHAMSTLLSDPERRSRTAAAARESASRFEIRRMVADYEALYTRLAGSP